MTPSMNKMTAWALAEQSKKDAHNADQAITSLAEQIKSNDKEIHAYIDEPKAIRRVSKPSSSTPLFGVPIAVKDNICIEGQEATCASKILKNYFAPYNATVIEKLLDAGAVLYGRTNMDEFAFGSSCETSCYGPTKNPRDLSRVPGGSSGGSAAAVASHMAIAALGSDTGGSIRQPAALCGVVGLKPTYGRVSRYGLIAFASSLDQIGPFTKDVRDSALLLNTMAGHDPKDSTSANMPVPNYLEFLGKDIKDLHIGVASQYQINQTAQHPIVDNAIQVLQKLGIKNVKTVDLPHVQYAVNVYYIVAPCEASSNLARFDGVRFGYRDKESKTLLEMYENTRGSGFGLEAKRRIILGTYSLSSGYYDAYYLKAMKVRTKIKEDFDKAFNEVDIILTPTAPSPAFKFGEKMKDPLQMYLSDIYTISANLAGIPAISVPGGIVDGLPTGLQMMAKPFDEGNLFRAAHAFEQATNFHKQLGNVQ